MNTYAYLQHLFNIQEAWVEAETLLELRIFMERSIRAICDTLRNLMCHNRKCAETY